MVHKGEGALVQSDWMASIGFVFAGAKRVALLALLGQKRDRVNTAGPKRLDVGAHLSTVFLQLFVQEVQVCF